MGVKTRGVVKNEQAVARKMTAGNNRRISVFMLFLQCYYAYYTDFSVLSHVANVMKCVGRNRLP